MLTSNDWDNARIEAVGTAFVTKVFYVFAFLALATAALSYAGKQMGAAIARGGHTESTRDLVIEVGDDAIHVSANMVRFEDARRSGAANKLDLYLAWPALQGYSEADRSLFVHANGQKRIVFTTFEPRTMERDMSGRLTPIYRLLMVEPGRPVEGGLVEHAFDESSGYRDEVLVLDPKRFSNPFVARCLTGPAGEAALASCERDVDVGAGLSMRYRFPRELLADWRELDAAMRGFADDRIARAEGR